MDLTSHAIFNWKAPLLYGYDLLTVLAREVRSGDSNLIANHSQLGLRSYSAIKAHESNGWWTNVVVVAVDWAGDKSRQCARAINTFIILHLRYRDYCYEWTLFFSHSLYQWVVGPKDEYSKPLSDFWESTRIHMPARVNSSRMLLIWS